MSDLISRESVIKELNELRRYVPFPSSKDVFDIIMKAKAIEQGEAVAYLYRCQHKQPNPKYTEWVCVSDNAHWPVDQWQSYEVLPLFTTPQQPQSVADALEEAAKICDDEAEGFYQRSGSLDYETNALEFSNEHAREAYDLCKELAEQIRALIKRNAKVVE